MWFGRCVEIKFNQSRKDMWKMVIHCKCAKGSSVCIIDTGHLRKKKKKPKNQKWGSTVYCQCLCGRNLCTSTQHTWSLAWCTSVDGKNDHTYLGCLFQGSWWDPWCSVLTPLWVLSTKSIMVSISRRPSGSQEYGLVPGRIRGKLISLPYKSFFLLFSVLFFSVSPEK